MKLHKPITAIFLVCAFFALVSAPAGARNAPKTVKAKLAADVTSITPGSTFNLGVLLNVSPGWHVYWKNSGDSGLPTSVEYTLPEGFHAGEPRWPVPVVFVGAGDVVDYGYEDSLFLYSNVMVPEGLSEEENVPLKAVVSWVSCKEICIPGKAELEIVLPVSGESEPANTPLFTEWEKRLPMGEFDPRNPFDIEVNTESTAKNLTSVNILLDARRELTDIALYPVPGDSLVVEDIRVTPRPGENHTEISFLVKRLRRSGTTQINLDTLIAFTEKDGARSGVELPVTLDIAE
ncbi:MAG TPA: protein-disulfide reductase DsbD family protein [Thermodesulfobacteriota bacterium]|nr:protein-disulfide reductase DsbD family protein [Thermodesulfobacteriota bacterium]